MNDFKFYNEKHSHIIEYDGDIPIGILGYRNNYMIYIEVLPYYRGCGVSTKMIIKFLTHIKEQGYDTFRNSYYEPDGELYIKHVIERECKKMNIILKEWGTYEEKD